MILPRTLSVAAAASLLAVPAWGSLGLLSRYFAPAGGAEIVSWDAGSQHLLATDSTTGQIGVEILDYRNPAQPRLAARVNVSAVFGAASATASASSVVADPLGRGFGAVAVIPTANNTVKGKVVFFNSSTGAILSMVEVGFHPDSVAISPNGRYVVVADEGEWVESGPQAPGSVSVIDLGEGSTVATLAGLTQAAVGTYDFQAPNLADGVSIAGLRVHTEVGVTANAYLHIEPEYITATDTEVVVTLQENNAIAVLDLATRKFSRILPLGTLTVTLDGSDRELPSGAPNRDAIEVNDTLACLPMPDTIGTYTVGGVTYFVTANEGDGRPDDGDVIRVSQTGSSGRPAIEATYRAALDAQYGGSITSDSRLGRLEISRYDGLNAQGQIVQLTAMGARGFSIWNGQTGALVYTSGSFFETYLRGYDPAGWASGRSDDAGPEPEALTVATIDGSTYAFIGLERSNAVMVFDITNPAAPAYYTYLRTSAPDLRPESIVVVPSSSSPTGRALVFVAYEGDDTVPVILAFDWLGNPVSAPAPTPKAQGTAVTLQTALPGVLGATYSAIGLPTGFTLNPTNGLLQGTAGPGTFNVAITANNGGVLTRYVIPFSFTARFPRVTWPTPDPIGAGTALGAAQLNAMAADGVVGEFRYSPAAGTVLRPGAGQVLSVTFVPTADPTGFSPVTVTTTIDVTGGYAGWAIGAFAGQMVDTSPMADPNGDGVTNGVAYALGLDPTQTIPANHPNLPVVSQGREFLQLSFVRPLGGVPGVAYRVQYATDMGGPWTDLPESAIRALANGPIEAVIATDIVPIAAGGQRFLRLWVEVL